MALYAMDELCKQYATYSCWIQYLANRNPFSTIGYHRGSTFGHARLDPKACFHEYHWSLLASICCIFWLLLQRLGCCTVSRSMQPKEMHMQIEGNAVSAQTPEGSVTVYAQQVLSFFVGLHRGIS